MTYRIPPRIQSRVLLGSSLALALALIGGGAVADDRHGGGGGPRGGARPEVHLEPHAGPSGYSRVTEPQGWNARPATVDRPTYQHNYQAARSYHIGVYRHPHGWVSHRWAYGETLPRAYWTSQYILADYWLFALEVPPAGYEWVRVDSDALLIDTNTGEVLQTEYGVFG